KTVVLEENYRSSQSLLNAAQALIALNKMRLVNQVPGLSKELKAKGEHATIPDLPALVQLPNEIHEAIHVADQIEALIREGVKPSEIAVLYRKHAQSEMLLREFRIRKLPFNTRKPLNILEDPLIAQLIEFSSYLKDELEQSHSGQHRLFHILHYGLYQIRPLSVATLASCIFKNYKNWRSALADICSGTGKADFLNTEELAELRRLYGDIEYWLGHASDWTVPVLLEKVIAKAGFLRKAMQSDDPAFQVEVLHSFHNLVKEENALFPNLTLNRLLDRISRRQSLGITVDVEQRAGTGEGVVFSTAHSSKGLEWEHVFIIGANYEEWEKSGPIKLPFRLGEVLVDLENLSDSDDEEMRRLFYVGITRAKKSLHISWRSTSLKGKALTPSSFTQVLADTHTAVMTNVAIPLERVLHSEAEALGLAGAITIPMPPEAYLRELVDKFELSPTAMQSYLDCPIRFYFNNLIRIPQAKSEYASFGSAVHDTLTQAFRIRNESGNFPDEDQLLSLFRRSMAKYRDGFTEAAFQRRMQQGMDILPVYYRQRLPHFSNHAEGMQEITLNARINGVPIKGKIDKVELEGNDAMLVDYKTGKVENGLKKLRELSVDETTGTWEKWGEYWLQLAFYQILAEADPNFNHAVAGLAIDFVEQNDQGISPIENVLISPSDLQLVKDKIVDTDKAIRAFKFDTGCGKKECDWCHFARYYQLTPPSEHPNPAEELNEPNP
ncbi:MAG: PD-(D/E)XK nuclease family protein, partial [Bacteroidetes bacterium]|nr:PD-(D/E)XK nuclease family protein [Bacteroidota bacterium]